MIFGHSQHQVVSGLLDSDLSIGDQIRFLVTSNSMHPIMVIGDTVVAEVIFERQITYGDILVIKREEDFLTHRVIQSRADGWLTKGDNNSLPDIPVKYEEIIGRVKLVQKGDRTIDLETRKWKLLNPLMAKIMDFESRSFSHHRYFRMPFRIMIKFIQKAFN